MQTAIINKITYAGTCQLGELFTLMHNSELIATPLPYCLDVFYIHTNDNKTVNTINLN